MSGEHAKKEETIYYAALEITSPTERSAYLKRVCGADKELLARVQDLLEASEVQDNFLEPPELTSEVTLEGPPAVEVVGTMIGRYKILEKIGEGGMAMVYMAEQKQPIRRKVALKIIKVGMDTKQVIGRFEAERQALAMMDHPNIAKVLDGGATEKGRPYFVMELVKGISITEYCDKNNLNTNERLNLFIPVCQAIQHAHQKGIIHRDIKPSNVLITMHDGKPVPRVIDFGIAKATNQQLTEKTIFTRYAQMIGTPEYMSPEQAEMSGLDIDTRTDIYSLGVLLYQLLTGVTPFDAKTLQEAGYAEIQRIIREEEPTKPSTKLSTLGKSLDDIAKHRKTTPDSLQKIMRGDLDWIVMESLEKDRTRRYATAVELAADLERHLHHKPVQAAAPNMWYKLRKFIRRHRMGIMASALIAATLILGATVSTIGFIQAKRERNRAVSAEKEAIAQRQFAQEQRSRAEDRELMTHRQLYASHMYLARQAWETGNIERTLELLHTYIPERELADLRSFSWYHLWHLCYKHLFAVPNEGYHGAFSPDGRIIATTNAFSTVKLWDGTTGQLRTKLVGHNGRPWAVAFSPDGSTLATGSSIGEIILWDIASGTQRTTLSGDPTGIKCIAFSPDGRMVAATGLDWDAQEIDGDVYVWEVATCRKLAVLREHNCGVPAVAFAPDSKTLASGSLDGTVKLWDTVTWRENLTWKPEEEGNKGIYALAYSPEGDILAVSGGFGTVKFLDPVTAALLTTPRLSRPDGMFSLAFSPDGNTLAGVSLNGTFNVWDVPSGQLRDVIIGHTHWIWSVAFSPDGKRLLSGSRDNSAKVWALSDRYREHLRSHPHVREGWRCRPLLAFSPDGDHLAVAEEGNTVALWNVTQELKLVSFEGHEAPVISLAFSRDGHVLATGSMDGTVKLWNTSMRCELTAFQPDDGDVAVSDLYFSPNGQLLAMTRFRKVLLVDVPTGHVVTTMAEQGGEILSVAFSPDGNILATGSLDGIVKLWCTTTGECKARYGNWHALMYIASVTFSPDGRMLVITGGSGYSAGETGAILLLDVASGQQIGRLRGHSDFVTSAAFSPDGKTLASGSYDGTVKLWDTFTWQEQMFVRCESHHIDYLTFSPTGNILAVGMADGTVQLWHAATDEDVARRSQEISRQKLDRWSWQGQWDKLADEFTKRIEVDPGDPEFWYRRGNAYAAMALWNKAVSDLAKAAELERCRGYVKYKHALAQLGSGDVQGYQQTCTSMLEHFGQTENPFFASWIVWSCVLAPNAVKDWSQLLTLAEFVSERNDRIENLNSISVGAAFYRAGRFETALQRLGEVASDWEPGSSRYGLFPYLKFFQSMAYHQMGNDDESRKCFDVALEQALQFVTGDIGWSRRLVLQLLRAEAESLLGVSEQITPNREAVVPGENE